MNDVLVRRTISLRLQDFGAPIEIDESIPDDRVHYVRAGSVIASIQDERTTKTPPRKRVRKPKKSWFESLTDLVAEELK